MAYVDSANIKGTLYELQDTQARTDISDLKSVLNGNYYNVSNANWVRKTINGGTGQQQDSTTRISLESRYYAYESGILVINPNGQKIWWYYYDSESGNKVSSATNWISSPFIMEIDKGTYFNLACAKLNEGTITVGERSALVGFLPNYAYNDIRGIGINASYWSRFKQKAAGVTIGQTVTFSDSTQRICTTDSLYVTEDISIKTLTADQYFSIIAVDADFIALSDTGWKTEYTIPAGTRFIVISRKSDNGTITPEDAKNIQFGTEAFFVDTILTDLIKAGEISSNAVDALEESTDTLQENVNALRTFSPAIVVSSGFPDFTYENGSMSIVMPPDAQCILPQYGTYDSNIINLSNKTGTSQDASGSLYYILYSKLTQEIRFEYFRKINVISDNDIVLGYASKLTKTFKGNIVQLYEDDNDEGINAINYLNSKTIFGVAHRGKNTVAPENTIPAFKAARKSGFRYAEFDVQWNASGTPVIIHDQKLNRTCCNALDGSSISGDVYINSLTDADMNDYDACTPARWSVFKGTKIPTFEETIRFCRKSGLIPIIELKTETTTTQAQVNELIGIVDKYAMTNIAQWLSYSDVLLGYVKASLPDAILWFTAWHEITNTDIGKIIALRTTTNTVGACFPPYLQTEESIALCVSNRIPFSNAEEKNTASEIVELPENTSYVFSGNVLPEYAYYIDGMS